MIYLDSSVVFSVHSKDANTPFAVQLIQAAGLPLVFTQLCEVEVVNALCLRLFRKEISQRQVQDSIGLLDANLRAGVFQSLRIPDSAYARAKALAQQITPAIGVRSSDLLHVASALELGASALCTFDRKQHRTATTAGMKVNPLP